MFPVVTDYREEDQLFDIDMFRGPVFQRPFQYLLRLDTGRQLQDVNPNQVEGKEQECLRVLLRLVCSVLSSSVQVVQIG